MPDLRIEHGNPTDAEVAALVVALTPTEEAEVVDDPAVVTPAWTRAALLEGTGSGAIHAPDELAARGR